MSKKPVISILTPTYNSASTLEMTLKSIRKQTYPQGKIEILIVDGGSKDNTLKIAKKYKCKILHNKKVGILEGEYLGFLKAKGKYLVGLAPDEVLENPKSLELKHKAFKENKKVKSVEMTGYKTPVDYASINHYVNEFGDPFTFFMYGDSNDYRYLISALKNKYKIVKNKEDYVVFSFSNLDSLPQIELWCGGCMLDLDYARKFLPEIKSNPSLVPLIFYLMNNEGMEMAVTKQDPTIHYSSGTLRKYFKKIRSRVEFNIFKTSMGMGGYTGREAYVSRKDRMKKYLFIPYSFSVVLPFIDSLYLSFTRRNWVYILHTPLCMYTSAMILYFYLIKSLNLQHSIKLYGH